MQLLRFFSVMALVLIIVASTSSNVSFKLGNNSVNNGINTKAPPIIEGIFLLSIDDKSTFSSLLQTISAQEQEEQQVEQEENGTDPDSVIEREEEQDRGGDSESESSVGQEQEEQSNEEEQKQDEIKEDCGSGQHFDSEVNSCMPDRENVCDDGRDNDNDSRVDLEDSDCLPSKNNQEQEQDNRDEDKEELLPEKEEQEASLDNKENDTGGENPISIEQQQHNNTSSDSSDTEDKVQNSSQNLTDNQTKTTSNNNASFNGSHQYTNASAAVEDSFTVKCHPAGVEMLPGEEDSITCTIENKTPKPIELVLECSGLDGTGIECYINGENPIVTTLNEMSFTNFSVLLVSRSSPPVSAGSYPFTISAEGCINSDQC
jgi:hypothetical protein